MKAKKKITVPVIRKMKGNKKIAMMTAYDFTMARLLDEAGLDVLLAGDSLGMVIQGKSTTLEVTLDEMCYHARLVTRGTQYAHVVGDLPFMSYKISIEQTLQSAARLVKEGGVGSVKLEGGSEIAEDVARLVGCGIPVMAHVGLTPQSINAIGEFRVQGRDGRDRRRIVDDAIALAQAGAYAIVLEAIPPSLAREITSKLSIPTIGIGAGESCDGQVLVCNDALGLTPAPTPRFVRRYLELGNVIKFAMGHYVDDVRSGEFPNVNETYGENP